MSSQWVRCAEALQIISQSGSEYEARLAICARAHQGLLRSRAQLLTWNQEKRSETQVPEKFWWAEGHEALDQDWHRGDFATWIDKVHWRAFGVEFDLDGLK